MRREERDVGQAEASANHSGDACNDSGNQKRGLKYVATRKKKEREKLRNSIINMSTSLDGVVVDRRSSSSSGRLVSLIYCELYFKKRKEKRPP